MSSFKKELLSQLHAWFDLANVMLLISTNLDPRSKAIMHTEDELLIVKNHLIEISVDFKLCETTPYVNSINDNNFENFPINLLDAVFNQVKEKGSEKYRFSQQNSVKNCIED